MSREEFEIAPRRRFSGIRGRSASRSRKSKEEKTQSNRSATPSKRNYFKKLLPKHKTKAASPSPVPGAKKLSSNSNSDIEKVVITPKVSTFGSQVDDVSESPISPLSNKAMITKKIHSESERDGFCRRVDFYDGTTIKVDGVPTYGVGNYLGGGVAGVVYEGRRLQPASEYPERPAATNENSMKRNNSILDGIKVTTSDEVNRGCTSIFCGPSGSDVHDGFVNDLKLEVDSVQTPTRLKSGKELMKDETVAVKILNPVGFRLATQSQCAAATVVKKGALMDNDVKRGLKPMTEEHVWWLVNPGSRSAKSLRNMKEQSADAIQGSVTNGIRLSVIAAYVDPNKKALMELPLTRCIEIWGHAPFGSTEKEFEGMMDAIERVNGGHSSDDDEEGRNLTRTMSEQGNIQNSGLYRASNATKTVEFCEDLNAYVTVPAVPPRYIRWLRQRRAVTKEIRNMMRIGRHKNVVHLFEVLELVQESKSTMFLVLEIVRGGELFDLISSNTATANIANENIEHLSESERIEYAMLKYFRELSAGIAYCHANCIAHRDLKPENLLVHNKANGECILKIADFGLSATFALSDSIDADGGGFNSPTKGTQSPITGLSPLFEKKLSFQSFGKTALSFMTCGGVEQISECFVPYPQKVPKSADAMNRMTSIVGSPHYVAPEIISQSDDEKRSESSASRETRGYDGTKADVWSAGVILYAMLFRSLPFGEDLLRCPRYQSFKKWYKEARRLGGRRTSAKAALRPVDRESEQADLGPQWFFPSQTSPESRDIIVAMLNPDPVERLNIQQVMTHPWISLRFVESSP